MRIFQKQMNSKNHQKIIDIEADSLQENDK